MKNKLSSRGGFMLFEMACAAVIAVLVSATVVAGCSAALRVRRNSEYLANETMLEQLINLKLGDTLRTAEYEYTVDGAPRFSSEGAGVTNGMFALDGGILILVRDLSAPDESVPLVDAAVYSGLELSSFELEYVESERAFCGSYTIGSAAADGITREVNFAFRTIRGE